MPDSRELPTDTSTARMRPDVTHVIEAAEHAAAAGDYAAAESLLREAAGRQEADLGPVHRDLANTLNNLAVLCDRTDKVADAEHFYRRAHAIATATLEPDHPFAATSRQNLIDFCEARGRPLGALMSPRAVATQPERASAIPVKRPTDHPALPAFQRPADRRFPRSVAIGAAAAFGLVLAVYVGTRPRSGSNGRSGSPPEIAITAPPPAPEPTPRPAPVPPTTAAKKEAAGRTAPAGEVANRAGPTAAASATPIVATARLCKTLSTDSRTSSREWLCDPPGNPMGPGSIVFYTRVKSAISTTIQHRWYRGNELRKVVDLRVGANPTEGYRTFSRNAVDGRGGGDWKVEMRTRDGVLLHQERFVVR